MITLIDASQLEGTLARVMTDIDWWARADRLGPVLLWRPNNNAPDLPSSTTWKEVVAFAASQGTKQVAILGADQLFLDPDVVLQGLEQAGQEWDYFTQFEHCRLPVGIGIRAVSLSHTEIAAWDDTPSALIRYIQDHPQNFAARYDGQTYVSYEQSRLESRHRNGDALTSLTIQDSPLKAFLKRTGHERTYQPKRTARFVDERLMPAAYGFESAACAGFPTYVMFDVTNVCNSRCIHCPHSTVFAKHKPATTHLDPAIFQRVIDECADHELQFIRVTADGEPLLHPQLADMLRYAGKKGVGPVGLTTNGSLMAPDKALEIIDSGIFMVDFSLDALTKETYAQIRQGLPFDKVVDNVETFIRLARQRRPEMKIMVSFVKQEANLAEEQAFCERWNPLVDKVLVRELISNVNLVEIEREHGAEMTYRWPCPHFFRRIVVNYDGVIKACPVDWENATAHLPYNDTTLETAWHSDFYFNARIEHLNNKFTSQRGCADCNDWQGSTWDLGYEKVVNSL